MSKKLSYIFGRPPGVERKNYRKYIVILITCITGFLGHIGFGTFFWIFDIDFLCALNAVSAIVWTFAIVLNFRGYHAEAILLMCAEMVVSVSATVALLGLDSGFQVYLWPLACLAVINPGLKQLTAATIGFSFILLIVLLKYFFTDVPNHAQLVEHIDTLYIVNTVIAGAPLILGMFSIRQINEKQERILTDLATVDELTGLYNRRYGNSYLKKKHHQVTASGGFEGCVVIGDIDHFKSINDKHGHDVGDRVLRVISSRLERSFRETDVICRWGGEEFLVILDEANSDKARRIVDRIRQELSKSIEINESLFLTVTMSFGLASTLETQSPKDLIKMADENLYRAKNNGRNCVYSNSLVEDVDKVISLGCSPTNQKGG